MRRTHNIRTLKQTFCRKLASVPVMDELRERAQAHAKQAGKVKHTQPRNGIKIVLHSERKIAIFMSRAEDK